MVQKIVSNEGFTAKLQNTFQQGYVEYEGNYGYFSEILPGLFGESPTLMQTMSSTINNLVYVRILKYLALKKGKLIRNIFE